MCIAQHLAMAGGTGWIMQVNYTFRYGALFKATATARERNGSDTGLVTSSQNASPILSIVVHGPMNKGIV